MISILDLGENEESMFLVVDINATTTCYLTENAAITVSFFLLFPKIIKINPLSVIIGYYRFCEFDLLPFE